MASTTVSLSGSPKKPTKNAFSQTVYEYGEACSLHGIQYIFEQKKNLCASRFFWFLIVCAGIAIGTYWSVEVSVCYYQILHNIGLRIINSPHCRLTLTGKTTQF